MTVGSAVGSVRAIFAKIKAIDAKHGKFDFVICAGDFFGPLNEPSEANDDDISQLLEGKIEGEFLKSNPVVNLTHEQPIAPLKCYIMQGEYPLPEHVIEKFAKTGGELCKDVFLLSEQCEFIQSQFFDVLVDKSGIITTAHGLRIACVGGIYDPNVYSSAEAAPVCFILHCRCVPSDIVRQGFTSPYFSAQTMERFLSNTLTKTTPQNQNYKSLAAIRDAAASSQLIDVLITNAWPASVQQFSSAPLPPIDLATVGASPLDEAVRRTKPRYHFSAGGGQPPMFWEREPFVWDDEEGRVSRFVNLGAFGGGPSTGKKQRVGTSLSSERYYPDSRVKWFYAFSIAPTTPSSTPIPRPANATKNPFTQSARPQKRPVDSEGENFIWGNVPQPGKRMRVGELAQLSIVIIMQY